MWYSFIFSGYGDYYYYYLLLLLFTAIKLISLKYNNIFFQLLSCALRIASMSTLLTCLTPPTNLLQPITGSHFTTWRSWPLICFKRSRKRLRRALEGLLRRATTFTSTRLWRWAPVGLETSLICKSPYMQFLLLYYKYVWQSNWCTIFALCMYYKEFRAVLFQICTYVCNCCKGMNAVCM